MARLHQNNFATNLTSNQVAGVTTTPLNDIPSIAAPFYLAFDATNINGKYEVVDVTSKTATNVLHAATTYEHTTAEEVRMVVPAVELDGFVGATDTVTLTNKTLTTPTINGATLTGTQAYGDNAPNITPKARAYRSAAYTSGTNFNKVPLEAESYDIGSDFDTTNNRFVAPVTGYYQVTGRASTTGTTRFLLLIYKNGTAYSKGSDGSNATAFGAVVSDIIPLAATDYVELWAYTPTGMAFEVGESSTFMAVHLISV